MKGDEIASFQQAMKVHNFHFETAEGSASDVGIENNDLQPQSTRFVIKRPADFTEADDPQDPPSYAEKRGPGFEVVNSRLDRAIIKRNPPSHGQEQGQSVVGDFIHTIRGDVRNQDAVAGGLSDVDVIKANAISPYGDAFASRLDNLGRNRLPAGEDSVRLGSKCRQLTSRPGFRDQKVGVDMRQ